MSAALGGGAARAAPSAVLLAAAYLGFISIALPDAALGIAWPFVRDGFSLPQSGLGLILAAVGAGFFGSSLLAGRLIQALGVGRLLAGSTALVGVALLGVAAAPTFPALLAAAPFVGLGSGAIDAGLNAYAARRFSARHMNWLHAAFGLGAAIGPFLMTAAIVATASWRLGYVAIAIVMIALALLFVSTRSAFEGEAEPARSPDEPPPARVGARDALRRGIVLLQVGIFCVYAGLEIAAGAWAFTVLSELRGLSLEAAGLWTGLYWGGLFVGRVLFGVVAERVGIDRCVALGATGALLGALAFALAPTPAAPAGLVLLGFACAPIYPMLMLRTPQRLGDGIAAHAIGFQVSAAMLGGILFPTLGGALADAFGLPAVPLMLVGCAVALLGLVLALERAAP